MQIAPVPQLEHFQEKVETRSMTADETVDYPARARFTTAAVLT
jgi:hypothetical protein